jgi:hypothetical protein
METDQREPFFSRADGQTEETEIKIDSQSIFKDFSNHRPCPDAIQKSQQPFGYQE